MEMYLRASFWPVYLRPETKLKRKILENDAPLFYLKALDLILKAKFVWVEKSPKPLAKFGSQLKFAHFLPTSIFNLY